MCAVMVFPNSHDQNGYERTRNMTPDALKYRSILAAFAASALQLHAVHLGSFATHVPHMLPAPMWRKLGAL